MARGWRLGPVIALAVFLGARSPACARAGKPRRAVPRESVAVSTPAAPPRAEPPGDITGRMADQLRSDYAREGGLAEVARGPSGDFLVTIRRRDCEGARPRPVEDWAIGYGYGFPTRELIYGNVMYTENSILPRERIAKITVATFCTEAREKKVDDYGHVRQKAGHRRRALWECVLERGNAGKFEWDNIRDRVLLGTDMPASVKKEAGRAISCRRLNSRWGPWE